jgi:hypothetical protein
MVRDSESSRLFLAKEKYIFTISTFNDGLATIYYLIIYSQKLSF